jgi:hypothetical protein
MRHSGQSFGRRQSARLLVRAAAAALMAALLLGAFVPLALGKTASKKPSLASYRGLGSWVDIYDKHAWSKPDVVVKDMASHGVRTLYIETGNSRSKVTIFNPKAQSAFIRAAHARGMKVVAWFLPSLKNVTSDYKRIAAAIAFRTSDGQRFDSFALDIESSAVKSEKTRNSRLNALTAKIRKQVGRSYPLGAIIPSPVALAKKKGYWNSFPYASIAKTYNVLIPMGYYTYHGKGASAASADALGNVRIIHAQPGCSKMPVHLIGGIAENSTASQVAAFAKASQKAKCIGASLYGWAGTTAAFWKALRVIKG